MFEVPENSNYLESHEYATTDGDVATIGITDFAQDELGDVVFVELPDEGDELTQGEEFGVVESIKAVSDLYAPVSGTVVDVNEDLFDRPELVNEDPYGDGWMLKVEVSDEGAFDELLSPEEYRDQTE
ncbi:glycine cleavage system protein GcvH [Halogeometricum borinquense]|uniref:Probable glycine cleavage system H protein n=2 Tax=Halogeometricum borinquense TaxID=60847 RepID=E4NP02_HALBP|nr:glycine cleavage system protein GcvH [Halogeometricum borinquense]ADQ66433.1 glycine cleavage system H protein [Halogeometricum borinquense DSM 11551]ELY31153.1 glycine cleavage system protein H [Halogeometricum borinquense DSM 11551]QIB75266.1 glycine cleavage system protein GcvH [Halogeometricum borinquense]QIQ75789.1 glycine cleavage system protein GcvH [Halogeometricum borinquense]RYJ15170.1 glycine cleavage system protein GcvH [Halogeometricum borinquense]